MTDQHATRYQRSIVTFIDILGFKEILKQRTAAEIDEILKLMQSLAATDYMPDLHTFAFSDSILRIRPVTAPGCLFEELLDLVHLQGELVRLGVLLRGGVTVGDMAWSGTRVFGPGLVSAYELESSHAQYPRIVVSPALVEEFAKGDTAIAGHHTLEEEAEYVVPFLTQGDDGMLWVDYLRKFPAEMDEPRDFPKFLRLHRELVRGLGASSSAEPTSLGLKANWLANYHNMVIAEAADDLKAVGVNADDLLIPYNGLRYVFTDG